MYIPLNKVDKGDSVVVLSSMVNLGTKNNNFCHYFFLTLQSKNPSTAGPPN